jgi:hypothetical protein
MRERERERGERERSCNTEYSSLDRFEIPFTIQSSKDPMEIKRKNHILGFGVAQIHANFT